MAEISNDSAPQKDQLLCSWVLPPLAAHHWVEETIEETFTYYRLPRQHHEHLKSSNMLGRLNEEIRRRTYVVRIFPNAEKRLVRALAASDAH
jgi:putative transposase